MIKERLNRNSLIKAATSIISDECGAAGFREKIRIDVHGFYGQPGDEVLIYLSNKNGLRGGASFSFEELGRAENLGDFIRHRLRRAFKMTNEQNQEILGS